MHPSQARFRRVRRAVLMAVWQEPDARVHRARPLPTNPPLWNGYTAEGGGHRQRYLWRLWRSVHRTAPGPVGPWHQTVGRSLSYSVYALDQTFAFLLINDHQEHESNHHGAPYLIEPVVQ